MEKDVYNSFKTLEKLTNLLVEKKSAWSQHLLLLASTLLGVLVSLQSKSSGIPASRWCFALAVALLALGILLTAASLYSHIDAVRRTRQAYTDEATCALRESRATLPVGAPVRKLFVACEVGGYICFVLAVIFLAAYSLLLAV